MGLGSVGPMPGVSSGEGIRLLAEIANAELPSTMAFEWTELAYLESTSGSTGLMLFGFSVVFVFLVLAALYESWALPLAVILVVPMCVLCSIAGVAFAKMDINIFTQIGFVVLIGLACKNAILIVEFAKLQRDSGADVYESILAACRQRLRPILMTSFAFILGVVPLAISSGAGAGARQSVGTGVMGGMLAATFLAIFFVPFFFKLITEKKLGEKRTTAELREEIDHHHRAMHASVHNPHVAPTMKGDRDE